MMLYSFTSGPVCSLTYDPASEFIFSFGVGEKCIRVWHNTPGLRKFIAELEDKRSGAKDNEVYKVCASYRWLYPVHLSRWPHF